MNINDHIKRKVMNEYRGSEQKETVILNDGKKYMIKKPDPVRELSRRDVLSYINNAYSEYVGCHIAQILGFSAQNTILGEYTTKNRSGSEKTKIVCLCEDVRHSGERMYELDTIALSTDTNMEKITFSTIDDILCHICSLVPLGEGQASSIRNFYFDLFVLDAFIGNTDRHNGNIALLMKEDGTFSRISPIYDCGSSLLPLVDESELSNKTILKTSLSLTSILKDDSGRRISYYEFLRGRSNADVDAALKRIMPKINLKKVFDFINSSDYLSETRKEFYCEFLQQRYDKILIPALERLFPLKEAIVSEDNLYQFYKIYLQPIAKLPEFQPSYIRLGEKEICCLRVNKKYAFILQDELCVALLPIRSNNGEIRKALSVLKDLDIDLFFFDRKLSDLASQNDDILKKSSNVLEVTSGENTSKIKGSQVFSGMVSKDPMGSPQKDLTPSPILPIAKDGEFSPSNEQEESYEEEYEFL